ncbi:sugar transferase [Brachybacterium sp. AOP25-B2-12]|uniref:sugar transferase n=1 Tax=Brachybacterium sp. AOP25-B2-12 TaxID=3457710 RepID=UPI004033E753
MFASVARDAAITAEIPATHDLDGAHDGPADGRGPVGGAAPERPDTARPVLVEDHRLTDLAHGPSGHLRRSAVAAGTTVVVALLVPAFAVPLGIAPAGTFAPMLLANLVWLAVTAALSLSWSGYTSARAVRPALTAGQTVVVGTGVLWAIGVPIPEVRAILLCLIATTLLTVLAIGLGARVFRIRTVVVAPVALLDDESLPRAEAVVVVDAHDDRESAVDRVTRAAVLAVDATRADVVRISGHLSPTTVSEISWALRGRGVPVQVDILDGTVRYSRLLGAADSTGVSVLVAPPLPSHWARWAKRTMDVVGSALIILALSPVLLAAAIAIKLDDRGPVKYRQVRIGKDGEPFEIYKLRTMLVDADARLQELLAAQQTAGTPLFKVKDDPRLTRVGGFMRRYSIDELPQLFNVLQGTMSLVGPRPQRAAEVAMYTGTDSHRLGVTPGMTGLWQVSGRSNLTWQEARRLDVHYAHNWSIALDLGILVRTVRAVLAKDGAV